MHFSSRSASALGACAIISIGGCASPFAPARGGQVHRRIVAPAPEQTFATAPPLPDGAPSEAPSVIGGALTLPEAVRIGMRSHPELRQAGYAVAASEGRVQQAGLAPNPTLGLGIESLGADAGEGGETTVLFEQEIPTAGRIRKARAVADTEWRAEQAAFRATAFDVASRVHIAFVRARAAELRAAEYESLLAMAEESYGAADARTRAGAATETDRLRSIVAREQALLHVAKARGQAQSARRALATAMGMESALDAPLDCDLAILPEIPDETETLALTLGGNAALDRAALAIERANRAHALVKADRTPRVVAAVGPRYSDLDNETTLDIGLGVEIPLFDRNQGAIAASLADRLGAGAALGAERLRLIETTVEAWAAFDTARAAAMSYAESVLPGAERMLDLTREAYRTGKTDFLRLIDAQETLVRARIAYLDALEASHVHAATLEGLMQRAEPWPIDSDPRVTENQP